MNYPTSRALSTVELSEETVLSKQERGLLELFSGKDDHSKRKKIYGCASIFLLLSIPFLDQKICTLFKTNSLHLFVLKIILLVFLVEVFLRQEQIN
jgi:hypothetical protein